MGDSAGGNLATVLTLLCRDNHMPQPLCQVLIYPGVTFVDRDFHSRNFFGRCPDMVYVLGESFLRKVKAQYMGEESNDRHPYLSPLEAGLTDDLAPALIITAECDPIRDDGRSYVEKLRAAGVEVTHYEYSGMIHGFMSFYMILGDALQAMKEIRDYLQRI
jgi:acetyl esterase